MALLTILDDSILVNNYCRWQGDKHRQQEKEKMMQSNQQQWEQQW